ncbi:MAG: carbohydrate ABC transporter permease [Clostridiales bacterium]|jgi:putative aldouronate transport system permease protein|nr:carbohydrate ABC transporter permease [Clostridiales bacterium]
MVTRDEKTQKKRDLDFSTTSYLNRASLPVRVFIYSFIAALCLVCLLPFINILAVSLSQAQAINKNPRMLFPEQITIEAYKYIFNTRTLLNSFGITVFATVVGTLFNLLVTTMGAYAVSKKNVPGQKIMMWIVIIPMLIGAGLIPTYLLYNELKLIDSVWVLVVSGLVAPFNLILMRNFFWSIPDSINESAEIDGAGDLTIFFRIVLPLSKSVLATVGLFYAVGHWNDYFTGLYFINSNDKWPLQVMLKSIIIDFNMAGMGSIGGGVSTVDVSRLVLQPENIRAATIIFSIVPILVLYPFLQKYFVKGVIVGSVKG